VRSKGQKTYKTFLPLGRKEKVSPALVTESNAGSCICERTKGKHMGQVNLEKEKKDPGDLKTIPGGRHSPMWLKHRQGELGRLRYRCGYCKVVFETFQTSTAGRLRVLERKGTEDSLGDKVHKKKKPIESDDKGKT